MPIFSYTCECGKTFDKYFGSQETASPFLNSYPCECGNVAAQRTLEGQDNTTYNTFSGKRFYSSNANPNKT